MVLTKAWISAASASDGDRPDLEQMKALTISVRSGSGFPTTRRQRHRRMPDQAVLDLGRSDADSPPGD